MHFNFLILIHLYLQNVISETTFIAYSNYNDCLLAQLFSVPPLHFTAHTETMSQWQINLLILNLETGYYNYGKLWRQLFYISQQSQSKPSYSFYVHRVIYQQYVLVHVFASGQLSALLEHIALYMRSWDRLKFFSTGGKLVSHLNCYTETWLCLSRYAVRHRLH